MLHYAKARCFTPHAVDWRVTPCAAPPRSWAHSQSSQRLLLLGRPALLRGCCSVSAATGVWFSHRRPAGRRAAGRLLRRVVLRQPVDAGTTRQAIVGLAAFSLAESLFGRAQRDQHQLHGTLVCLVAALTA